MLVIKDGFNMFFWGIAVVGAATATVIASTK